jgi:tetratricopeptide (TPR) repeat protein
MAAPPLALKLRCTTWDQLARMHERDLTRGALFMKSAKPPPIGTEIRIDLTIPSGSTIRLDGRVGKHVSTPDRGAGVDVVLAKLPASDMWVIESALVSAGFTVKSASAQVARAAPAAAPPSIDIPIEIDEAAEEPDAAAAEFDLVQALEAELVGLRAMNPFQVLGVSYDADDQAVRSAFNELTKKYHPDRFARYESETARALAGEIFILVREAYRRLGDANQRAGARAAVTAQAPTTTGRAPGRIPTPPAGVPIMRGHTPQPTPALPLPSPAPSAGPPLKAPPPASFEPEKVLSFRSTGPQPIVAVPIPAAPPAPSPPPRPATPPPPPIPAPPVARSSRPTPGNAPLNPDSLFGDAEVPAGPAPGSTPVSAAASPFVARGEQLLEAGRYQEAWQAFDAAARSQPLDRSARVGRELARGFEKLADGDRLTAAQAFESALEIDPMNERAARELAAMRRAATDARRGLLGKLLGKKT